MLDIVKLISSEHSWNLVPFPLSANFFFILSFLSSWIKNFHFSLFFCVSLNYSKSHLSRVIDMYWFNSDKIIAMNSYRDFLFIYALWKTWLRIMNKMQKTRESFFCYASSLCYEFRCVNGIEIYTMEKSEREKVLSYSWHMNLYSRRLCVLGWAFHCEC